MRHTPKPSEQEVLAQNMAATKLAIEKTRLAKLEGEQPQSAPQYTRYEDMPPPSPEERADGSRATGYI